MLSTVRATLGGLFVAAMLTGLVLGGLVFTGFFLAAILEDGLDVGLTMLALVVGGLLSIVIGRRRHSVSVPDAFADASRAGIINMSNIRVAGIGGFGFVIVALAAAFEFRLVFVVVAAGLVGGLLSGAIMIFRRRHHPLDAPAGGPAGLQL